MVFDYEKYERPRQQHSRWSLAAVVLSTLLVVATAAALVFWVGIVVLGVWP